MRQRSKTRKIKNENQQKMPGIVTDFVKYHPPRRLSTNLRSMLIDFLISEGALESIYLQDLLYDMGALFELLDALESEEKHLPPGY